MIEYIGQILAIGSLPLGAIWFYLFVNRGHEMTPELNKWSKFREWPTWFYLAPIMILCWVVGIVLCSIDNI